MTDLTAHRHEEECVDRDSKYKQPAGRIADLEPKALEEAGCRGGLNLVRNDPFETDEESKRLLQIGQHQIVDEDDILVVTDVPSIVTAPEHQSVRDEGD